MRLKCTVKPIKVKPCGSFGDISIFSFYSNKHITTGEGGMIVTNQEDIFERCRSLRNLYFQPQRRFIHEELGWNLRMTNLQAAVGLAQLEQLETFVERKRKMGRRYRELLQNIPCLELPLPQTDYAENIYWVYGIVLKDEVNFDAMEAMKRLQEHQIGTHTFSGVCTNNRYFTKWDYCKIFPVPWLKDWRAGVFICLAV
jgi:perosamine synthetase